MDPGALKRLLAELLEEYRADTFIGHEYGHDFISYEANEAELIERFALLILEEF